MKLLFSTVLILGTALFSALDVLPVAADPVGSVMDADASGAGADAHTVKSATGTTL